MTASRFARIADAQTFLIAGAAPKLNTTTNQEIRVVAKRSRAEIERDVMAQERRHLIRTR